MNNLSYVGDVKGLLEYLNNIENELYKSKML